MENMANYKIKLTSTDKTKCKEIVKFFPMLSDRALDATAITAEDGTVTVVIEEPGVGKLTISSKSGVAKDAIIHAFLICVETKARSDGAVVNVFSSWGYEDFRSMFSVERIR